MYDVISIGSSIVDSFITSKSFQVQKTDTGVLLCQTYGEKIDVDEYIIQTGGGGSNTAVGFARMGFRTAVVTELGKDVLANFIIEELHKERVATNLVISEKNEKTGGSIILLGADGQRTIMVHRGAAAQLDPKDIPAAAITHSKWVHLSSIAGQEKTLKFIFDVTLDAHTHLSWNPGNKELQLLLHGAIDLSRSPVNVLFVNRYEWELIRERQAELLQVIPQIVVTEGKHGGEVFMNGKHHIKFFSQATKAVDETGAGDAFIVGYISGKMKGKAVAECCNWGKRNAESVVSKIGAKPGLLTIIQIESHNGTHE
ncbi:carbohydrate kinase family protein [Candidatus Woesebacteria bacterium]|nr:carbohydrate kinase family protein [Candidatus Woesebacteria bacterium]